VRSNHESLPVGERVFGYLPSPTHLVVRPTASRAPAFVDASSHRQSLPPVYNQYTRVANDRATAKTRKTGRCSSGRSSWTAFLLDDFLADNGFFGARTVVLSSASSKTAFGLAFLLRQRGSCRVVGLTSPANRAFVEGLDAYDQVVTYDRVPSLPADVPTVFVDMAGQHARRERHPPSLPATA